MAASSSERDPVEVIREMDSVDNETSIELYSELSLYMR